MAEDTLDVRLRLRDAASFIRGVAASGAAVAGFGDAAELAGKKTEFSRIETFLWRQSLYTLRRELFYGTLALTGLGAGVLKVGYDFNEAEQKATAAFTGILGSARLARREVDALVGLTHATGFQLPQLADAATKMLDFGFSVEQTNKQLKAFGIFAQKRNLGIAGIDALTSVFARIKDQGQLTGRVLMQLRSQGVPAIQILTKQLHLTAEQVSALQKGKLSIPAAFAIPALTAGIAATPGAIGLSGLAGMARSWVAQLTGLLGKPLFAWAERIVPSVNRALARGVTGFKTGGMRGLLLGIEPSGRLLTAWLTLGNVVQGFVTVGRTAYRAFLPFLPLFVALTGLFVAVAGHATLLKVVLYALAVRYLYLRGVVLAARAALYVWNVVMKAGWVAIRLFYAAEKIWIGVTKAAAAAQWALNVAMDANPISLLIIGAVALGAGLAILVLKVRGVRDAFVDTFNWVRSNWPLLLGIIATPIGLAVYEIVRHFDVVKKRLADTLGWIVNKVNWVVDRIGWAIRQLDKIPLVNIPPVGGSATGGNGGIGGLLHSVVHAHIGPVPVGPAGVVGIWEKELQLLGRGARAIGLGAGNANAAVLPVSVQPLRDDRPLHVHLHIGDREVLESVIKFPGALTEAVFGQVAHQGARA